MTKKWMDRFWNSLRVCAEDGARRKCLFEIPRERIRELVEVKTNFTTVDERIQWLEKLHHYLRWIANVPGEDGALRIRDGDLSGWSLVILGWSWAALTVRVELCHLGIQVRAAEEQRQADRRQRGLREISGSMKLSTLDILNLARTQRADKVVSIPSVRPIVSGDNLFLTMLLGIVLKKEQASRRYLSALHSRSEIASSWVDEPLWRLLYLVCCRWQAEQVELAPLTKVKAKRELAMLSNWNSPKWESEELPSICDLCLNARRRSLTPITLSPCMVFPVEVLSIQLIRESLGYPRIHINHPILETPLLFPPENIVDPEDTVFSDICNLLAREFPET